MIDPRRERHEAPAAAQVRAFILAGALELDLIERMRADLARLVAEWDGPLA